MKCGWLIVASIMASVLQPHAAPCTTVPHPATFLRVFLFGPKEGGGAGEVVSVLNARDYRCTGEIDVDKIRYTCSVSIRNLGAFRHDFDLAFQIPRGEAQVTIRGGGHDQTITYERGSRLRQQFPPGADVQFSVTYAIAETRYDFMIEEFPVMYSNNYEQIAVTLDRCQITMALGEQFGTSAKLNGDLAAMEEMEAFSSRDLGHATEYSVKMRRKCPHLLFWNPIRTSPLEVPTR